MSTESGKNRENGIRRLARRYGYAVRKSRGRKYVPHADNFGEFMLVEANRNLVVLGERFDASLDDIEFFLGPPKAA